MKCFNISQLNLLVKRCKLQQRITIDRYTLSYLTH